MLFGLQDLLHLVHRIPFLKVNGPKGVLRALKGYSTRVSPNFQGVFWRAPSWEAMTGGSPRDPPARVPKHPQLRRL